MGYEVIRVPLDYKGPHLWDDIEFEHGTTYPPKGEGYALWQNTSEAMMPGVFPTLRELCVYLEKEITWFEEGDWSADEWFEDLRGWVGE